jgi:hypothetical protein
LGEIPLIRRPTVENTEPEVLSSGVPKEMTEVEHLVGSSN